MTLRSRSIRNHKRRNSPQEVLYGSLYADIECEKTWKTWTYPPGRRFETFSQNHILIFKDMHSAEKEPRSNMRCCWASRVEFSKIRMSESPKVWMSESPMVWMNESTSVWVSESPNMWISESNVSMLICAFPDLAGIAQ